MLQILETPRRLSYLRILIGSPRISAFVTIASDACTSNALPFTLSKALPVTTSSSRDQTAALHRDSVHSIVTADVISPRSSVPSRFPALCALVWHLLTPNITIAANCFAPLLCRSRSVSSSALIPSHCIPSSSGILSRYASEPFVIRHSVPLHSHLRARNLRASSVRGSHAASCIALLIASSAPHFALQMHSSGDA